jgi:hypothetical protein
MKLLWRTGFEPLVVPRRGIAEMLVKLGKIVAVGGFFLGSIYGLAKRHWKILALLIFFVPYFILHARYPYPLQRFHANVFWIPLLICWFGLQGAWRLIDGNGRVPPVLVLALQALVAIIAIIGFGSVIGFLPKTSQTSPRSASVPYVAMVLVGLIFAARVYVYRSRYFLRELSILALLCLIIVSNQFPLVGRMGDGKKEQEFKLLADWCVANTEPGEKMGLYMSGMVKFFAPERVEDIVSLPKADSPQDFVEACYEEGITYVVWATREGAQGHHTGYRQLGLHKNIAMLNRRENTGPYEYIDWVGWERGYVHIFRLRKRGR